MATPASQRTGMQEADARAFEVRRMIAEAAPNLSFEHRYSIIALLLAGPPSPAPVEIPAPASLRPLVTAEEVAARWEMHRSTVYKKARYEPRWRDAVVRIGPGSLRFDPAKLEKALRR